MKNLICGLLGLILTFSVYARPVLKVGDVLLQPTACWSCSLIEAEEETIYSHIGVVLSLNPLLVAEALGKVRAVSFEEFNIKTEKGQKIGVLRLRNEKAVAQFEKNYDLWLERYQEFDGLPYDKEFRWNNFDDEGREKFYCSELVSKLYQAFLGIETPIKRMHFNKNREAWVKYFKGNVPDGEWGNSPGDFERSHLFYFVGEL